MSPRRLLWGLIVASGVARLLWGSALGLGMDEAYHAQFLDHPDWSYFDHPPMLALVEGLGVAAAGGRVEPITLRLGFILPPTFMRTGNGTPGAFDAESVSRSSEGPLLPTPKPEPIPPGAPGGGTRKGGSLPSPSSNSASSYYY